VFQLQGKACAGKTRLPVPLYEGIPMHALATIEAANSYGSELRATGFVTLPGGLPGAVTRATSTTSFSCPKPRALSQVKDGIGEARLYRWLWSQRLDLA
jgi:hypothetical protein